MTVIHVQCTQLIRSDKQLERIHLRRSSKVTLTLLSANFFEINCLINIMMNENIYMHVHIDMYCRNILTVCFEQTKSSNYNIAVLWTNLLILKFKNKYTEAIHFIAMFVQMVRRHWLCLNRSDIKRWRIQLSFITH